MGHLARRLAAVPSSSIVLSRAQPTCWLLFLGRQQLRLRQQQRLSFLSTAAPAVRRLEAGSTANPTWSATSSSSIRRHDVQQHSSSNKVDVPFHQLQLGVGTIGVTASVDNHNNSISKLVALSHKAPVRLIPQKSRRLVVKDTNNNQHSNTSGAQQHQAAAVVAVAHYGGGLAAGDTAALRVQVVGPQATLFLTTQSPSRVYKQPSTSKNNTTSSQPRMPSLQTLDATIGPDSFLVSVPDPVVLQAGSVYHQHNVYTLQSSASSSLVAVDWIAGGRWASGERWQQDELRTRTELRMQEGGGDSSKASEVVLVDAQMCPVDTMLGHAWNCYATVLLCGPRVQDMLERFRHVQRALLTCQSRASIRTTEDDDPSCSAAETLVQQQLAPNGRVILGMSCTGGSINSINNKTRITTMAITGEKEPNAVHNINAYTIRLTATSNEDVYRILNFGIGLDCYRERITASRSAPIMPSTMDFLSKKNKPSAVRFEPPTGDRSDTDSSSSAATKTQRPRQLLVFRTSTSTATTITRYDGTPNNYWNAYMLADSALPTGSFAHSVGLEAAIQLGLFKDDADNNNNIDYATSSSSSSSLMQFVTAATQSTITQSVPLLWASHRVASSSFTGHESTEAARLFVEQWQRLDRHMHAMLMTNAPACRASLDQGRSLMRLAGPLVREQQPQQHSLAPLNALLDFQQKEYQADHHRRPGRAAPFHWATVFGVVTQQLQISEADACQLLGYTVARDVVSAAVRLHSLGPAAGQVALGGRAQASARAALARVEQRLAQRQDEDDDPVAMALAVASACAPVLDAVHPCHDVLAMRLFRT